MSKERKRGVRLATQAALVIFVILLVSLGATLPLVAVDFVRGDANSDGRVSIADAHFLLSHVFRGFTSPECMDAGDFTDDEKLNITDSVQLLRYLVLGGSPPPSPFPS